MKEKGNSQQTEKWQPIFQKKSFEMELGDEK